MENLGKQSGESVDPVEDPPPGAVPPTQDQSTSESLVDSSAQQQPRPPPPLSPLTGCYLLIVVGEPHSDRHKEVILQKIAKAFLSWDVNQCHVSLEKELQVLVAQSPEGEEARFGERLIQYATENLVTEILIHPQLNTLHQCMKNLLSSFTKHRHIIHAGYTFAGNGSWILQDGTLSVSDLIEALHEPEVIRVLKAYGNSVSIDVHCASEGEWTTERFQKEPASKLCTIRINPGDVMTAGNPAITSFINYLSPFLVPANIQQLLQPTDVVGNIRFTHPTLYVFPGGQGDAALFGINGFNMLIDGGFARKACFWDFARHLDRLDAVLLTRLNNSTVNGISAVLQRKKMNHVYPQIGHFFCNLQDRKIALSPDGDKDKDSLIVNLAEEGQEIVANLRHLALKPHPCYRDGNQVDPVNLYHKVGHGKLDMYVISPARDSQAVKEFLSKWTTNDSQLFSNTGKKTGGKAFEFPLQNLVSICALLVWQPANPSDTITRILFPGSTPQHKIFEGLEKLRHLEFLKHPVCSARSISPSSSAVSMTRSASKGRQPKLVEKVKETKPIAKSQPQPQPQPQPPTQSQPKPVKPKVEKSPPKEVKEISSTVVEEKKEVEKPIEGSPKRLDNRVLNKEEQTDNVKDEIQKIEQTETDEIKKKVVHKSKYDMKNVKPKVDSRAPSKSVDRKKVFERKPGGGWPSPPGTPKKAPLNGTASKAEKAKAAAPKPVARVGAVASSSSATSPTVTPAKSAKEANNRKVVEARVSATKSPPKPAPVTQKKEGIPPTPAPQPLPQPPPAPVHRRQVRRPRVPQSPVRAARAPKKVVKKQDIDPDVVRTYDPSIDVELGLGVETLKTDLIRQVTRGLDENRETEERTVMVEMDAAQAEEEEAKLKRDEEETEDVETDEPEEYLIITRQVVDYPHPQTSAKATVITRETTEIEQDELEKLVREEIECEKEEDVFLPETPPIEDLQELVPPKEEVKDKTADEGRAGDKSPEGGESELQKLMDVDEGIDLKEPVSKEHKEGESLPEEKISNTVETSATTAPTLPEDERIEEPMIDEAKVQQDDIKEVIEEKYTQEETKEDKQQKKIEEAELKQPTTLPDIDAKDGIISPQPTQKKRHPRDVVKTPDEVADLPMHEEVDPGMYSSGDFTKEMQKKTEDDKTPTEKKPDFGSLVKEEADFLEDDEGSEKSEESKKAVEKAEEPTKEEKDGHGDSITSQYLNIIDKLEKSTTESKKDDREDIQPEEVEDRIIKESEIVEGEDEKILEVPKVDSKMEEPEVLEEKKLQPQDGVKSDEKRSPSPAKETEIMPKEDENVSALLDSKVSLQPDLSGKSTPQEPEIISGKSSPLVLEKATSGKATPLDLEKESSGKSTPADLGRDVSGKATPADSTKDVSGKSTPADLGRDISGKSTPAESAKDVSGKATPADFERDVSDKSTPAQSAKDVSGKATPADFERDVSGKSTPAQSAKDVSGKATPADFERDVSGKSTPAESAKDVSGKPTPADLARDVSGKSTPAESEKDISGKATPADFGRDVSGKSTPADLAKDVSGKSTPADLGRDTSGKATPADSVKDISGKTTPADSAKDVSGKSTPADLANDISGKSTPQDGIKDTSQATSGKSTPMDLEVASRRHSQILEKELSGKSTPLDSVSGKTSPQGVTGKSSPLEMAKDLFGKVTPLEMGRPSSRESSYDEKVSNKSGHYIEKDDSDKSESHVPEQITATPQNVSGKTTPHHLDDETSPRITPHDLEIKPTPTQILDDTSRGPTPQDVTSGKATPIDAEKPEEITPHEIKRMSITQEVDTFDVVSGKSSRRESTIDDYEDRRSSLQSLVGDKSIEAPTEIPSGKSSPLGKEPLKVSEEQLTEKETSRKVSLEKDIDEEVRKRTPEVAGDVLSSRKTSIQDFSGKVSPSDVTGSETVIKSERYDTDVQEKDVVGKKMPVVESSVSDSVSSGPPEKDVSGKSTPFSTDKETSAVGGKVTSDSFSIALAEKGTSGTYSLEKETGDKSSSPSPVDISPLSLDEIKETPKERKSGETSEKDVVAESEDVETERKEEKKYIGEASTSFYPGKSPILERIKQEEGESSGTSSPDRSLPEKSESSLPNGMESEEECEKGILESEKHEKESQILDISSGEEEELKALSVDDDDGDSETETRRRQDDIEEGVEVEESGTYVEKLEKEDMEKSEKAEREAGGLESGEKTKVKRMLITASSEDGGTETEICIQETAKFIKKEVAAQEVEKAVEVVEEEKEDGDFSNLILQAKMEYDSQRSRKSSYNSSPEDVEGGGKVEEKQIQNGGKKDEEEEEEEEEELGTLLMQARQELAFVRSKSRESQLSQPEMTKLMKTTTTTTSESTRIDDDNDIITITTILTEEREEQEDGSIKVTTTKETTTTGGKDEGTVVSISTEFESKKTEEEKSQVNSGASESGMDKQRSSKGDGEGKTSQEEVTTETSRRTSASSIISQEDLVSRKDSAKIEDFRQSSTEMSPLKTTYITTHGDSESLMTSSFYGNLPTEDEMIGKSEHHSREFRRGRGYESVTEVGPYGERTEKTYFYGTEEDPTRAGRDKSKVVKAYYTEEEHQREGEHSHIGVKYHPSGIPEEEGTVERTRFIQHYYEEEEEEEPKAETEEKLRFVQRFSGEEAAEHVDFAKAIDEHISARGEYLGKEIRQDVARYTNGKRETEPEEEEDEEGAAAAAAPSQEKDKKKDIIHEWGKPLGLPLPPRNKTYTFPRQNISTTSSLSTPSDNSDSVTNWGQPMSLPSPAPPSVQNGVVETLPTKPKESSKMEKKVHMKKNVSSDNKSSGNNTPNRRSESPVKQGERRTPSTGRTGRGGASHLYLDLTYVPHHGNSYYSNVEFFKKIRARYYVFSGTEPSKEVYNALLEAKQTWEDKKLEVTIIPTYDTDVLGYWVAENEEVLAKHKIDLSPSASRCTINLQDHETSCSAYRLEF